MKNYLKYLWLLPLFALFSCGEDPDGLQNQYAEFATSQIVAESVLVKVEEDLNSLIGAIPAFNNNLRFTSISNSDYNNFTLTDFTNTESGTYKLKTTRGDTTGALVLTASNLNSFLADATTASTSSFLGLESINALHVTGASFNFIISHVDNGATLKIGDTTTNTPFTIALRKTDESDTLSATGTSSVEELELTIRDQTNTASLKLSIPTSNPLVATNYVTVTDNIATPNANFCATDITSGRVSFEADIPALQTSASGTATIYESRGELDLEKGLGYLSIPNGSETQYYCFYFKGRTTDSTHYSINNFNSTFNNDDNNDDNIDCGAEINNLSDLAEEGSFIGCRRQ